MRSLEGQTALVAGGGTPLGRAIALALAARGVRIVVTGRDEKALGLTVGEVVHAGGKARHLAGDVRDPAHLARAVERALEVFGALDIVVAADAEDAPSVLAAPVIAARPSAPGRLLVAAVDPSGAVAKLVRESAVAAAARGSTCNAIVVDPAELEDDAADDVGALAAFLCSRAGARITGQAIAIGLEARQPSRG
jgi:NAD(P)-dependent dehydrogenase (short-subunit alcohol dehydrogenase family)